MAYYRLDPFGEDRADLRNAMLSVVCASPYSKKKLEVSHFLPKFGEEKKEPEQGMKSVLKNITKKFRKK